MKDTLNNIAFTLGNRTSSTPVCEGQTVLLVRVIIAPGNCLVAKVNESDGHRHNQAKLNKIRCVCPDRNGFGKKKVLMIAQEFMAFSEIEVEG